MKCAPGDRAERMSLDTGGPALNLKLERKEDRVPMEAGLPATARVVGAPCHPKLSHWTKK
jgi:hypothetical protein